MVLTVSFVSPGDRALWPPSPWGLKVLSSPVEPNEPPQDLTPASRRQDHTTSPSASSAVVLHAANRSRRAIRPALASHAQHCCVHRTPPRVRDDHDTPLWWGGMATVLDLIWVRWQQIFFGKSEIKDSTALSTNRPTGKSLGCSPDGAKRNPGPVSRESRISLRSIRATMFRLVLHRRRWQQIFFGKSEIKDSTALSTNRPTAKSRRCSPEGAPRNPGPMSRQSRIPLPSIRATMFRLVLHRRRMG